MRYRTAIKVDAPIAFGAFKIRDSMLKTQVDGFDSRNSEQKQIKEKLDKVDTVIQDL
jgi:hypothetical protein